MNILCRLGKHKWHGCKCEKCGTVRDTGHEFYRGSSYGRRPSCTCEICGKVIDRNHCWFGCKCGACGKVRDEQHDFKNGVCTQCGKKIPVHLNAMTERERALLVFDDQYSPSTRMEALDSVSIDAALDAFRSLPAQEPGKRPKKGDSGISEVTRAFLGRLSQDTLKELVSSGYWAACVNVEDTDFLIKECVKADMISDCIQNLENDRKQVILQARPDPDLHPGGPAGKPGDEGKSLPCHGRASAGCEMPMHEMRSRRARLGPAERVSQYGSRNVPVPVLRGEGVLSGQHMNAFTNPAPNRIIHTVVCFEGLTCANGKPDA